MFMTAKKKIGLKLEGTKYTAETLAGADFDFRAYDITYSIDIAEFKRAYATNDYGKFQSIAGKRKGTVGFKIDLAPHASAAANAPEWDKLMQSCGMEKTTGGSGLKWIPKATKNAVPATIDIRESEINETSGAEQQVSIVLHGCMGNVQFDMDDVGNPVRCTFSYQGVLNTIVDKTGSDVMTPSGFDAVVPPGILQSTLTAFGEAQAVSKVSINLNNEIEVASDPSTAQGLRGAYITDRNPSMTIDPYLDSIADRGNFARWTGGTTGTFSMTIGSNLTIIAPAIQITKAYDGADRNGIVANTLTCILTRTADNTETDFRLVQGTEP